MKELYSFKIKRKVKEKIAYDKEGKDGKVVEAFKTKTKSFSNRVIFYKPNFSAIEEAEFFYGQKYNEYINSGYLTRSMLSKKIGDVGGSSSKLTQELLSKAFLDNMESARTIEFYEGQKNLSQEQEDNLTTAKKLFASSSKDIQDYESFNRMQFSQTAEAKAEQRLMEWFIFNFSYYEESLGDKNETFPLFVGDDFENKRSHYLMLSEDEEDISGEENLKNKSIFDLSFDTLAKVSNLWYNKMGANQKEIEENLKAVFSDDEVSEEDE